MIHNISKKAKHLWNHSGFRRYFFNTAWLFFEKFLRLIVGLFVSVWLARYLGPSQYGLFSYAHSFVALVGAVATLGLDGIVVRELVKDETKRDILLGTSLKLKILGAFLVYIILAIAIKFTNNDRFTNLLIFIIAAGYVFQSFNVIDLYFRAKVISKFSVIANSISFLLSSIAKIILILLKAPLIAFAAISVFDQMIITIGYIYFYKKCDSLALSRWRFDSNIALKLLKDSWPLIFSGIVVTLYMRIDQVMIKNMLGNWAVGQYAVAVRITEVFLFIPVVITQSIMPSIIKAKTIDTDLYYSRLQILYQLLILISFVISVVLFLGKDKLILLLFGPTFQEAAKVLAIYVWSNIFIYMNNASWQWYLAENLQFYASLRLALGALVNILMNLYMIPHWGITGAAWATLISYSIATYFGNLISRKTIKNFVLLSKALLNFWNIQKYKYLF